MLYPDPTTDREGFVAQNLGATYRRTISNNGEDEVSNYVGRCLPKTIQHSLVIKNLQNNTE